MDREITVRVVVRDPEGRFLLVHEIDEGGVGRPAGWHPPGGHIEPDETKEMIIREIARFPHRDALYAHLDHLVVDGDDRCFVGAVREVLEETGYLVRVKRELYELREEYVDHEVHHYEAEVVAGELVRMGPETDDAGWFLPSELPFPDEERYFSEGLYPSARVQLTRARELFEREEKEREEWCRAYAAWAECVSHTYERRELQ